jgi:hypothetical protein
VFAADVFAGDVVAAGPVAAGPVAGDLLAGDLGADLRFDGLSFFRRDFARFGLSFADVRGPLAAFDGLGAAAPDGF